MLFVKIKQVYKCYLRSLKSVELNPALHQVSAFPSAVRLKEKRALSPLSARKQTDTSVHAQLPRLTPHLPPDPPLQGSRRLIASDGKYTASIFFAYDFVQCSKMHVSILFCVHSEEPLKSAVVEVDLLPSCRARHVVDWS
ncbi:hypothetical protein AMECASPLE_007766 [Ameca splendens]|uniref:Uncharacterized protein n=1 Tax=Ameca splendens TaxID=208324 RepID=A0ABV0Z8Y5_9TELE